MPSQIRWAQDGDTLYAINSNRRLDYEVRCYGTQAQAVCWPIGYSGKPACKQVFVGPNALEQAKQQCKEWDAAHGRRKVGGRNARQVSKTRK